MKDALIVKLVELDTKLYHLYTSNQYLKQEAQEAEDQAEANEYLEFVKENEEVITDKKGEVLKILTAFMKAGTDIERDIYPKMKYNL